MPATAPGDRLGRRRPYFLAGAILSSSALILMPRSSALWMAAGLLWILDASINISMEPFRAFVADLLPEYQRTRGFAMQSLFIGLGAVIASALPYLLTNVFHVTGGTNAGAIPFTVRLSFYIGAAAFLGAVLWTVFTTKEYPPENLAEFQKQKAEHAGLAAGAHEILTSIGEMPRTMRQLAWVQIFTWLGLFCMWLYFPVAVARNVFGAADTASPSYSIGVEWAGVCFGMYSLVCFGFSFVLPALARQFGRKATHSFCLICGGLGLLSVAVIHDKYLLLALDDWSGYRLGQYTFHALCDSRGLAATRENRCLHGHFQFLYRDSGDYRVACFRLGNGALAAQQPIVGCGSGRSLLLAGRRPYTACRRPL